MFIGEFKEFYPRKDYGFPSIASFISDTPHPDKAAVISYLKSGGRGVAASTGVNKDVFTGDVFGLAENLRDDGEFQWSDTLAHYVDKYNLRLPDEFVAKALEEYGAGA